MRRNKRLPKLPASPAPDWFDFRSGARPEIFSIEFVQGLTRKFKIDTAKIPELKLALAAFGPQSCEPGCPKYPDTGTFMVLGRNLSRARYFDRLFWP